MDFETFKKGKINRKRFIIIYSTGFLIGLILPNSLFTHIMKIYYDYIDQNTFAYRKNKLYSSIK